MKNVIKARLGLLVVLMAICMCACGTIKTTTVTNLYDDLDTAKRFFPAFNSIEVTSYFMEALGGGSRVPGPTDYRYEGMLIIGSEDQAYIDEHYELVECEVELDDNLCKAYPELKDQTWRRDPLLDKELPAPGFAGKIYVSGSYIYYEISAN